VLILAPIAGTIIAETCRLLIRKRRSKRLYQSITIATALGSFPPILANLLGFTLSIGQANFSSLVFLIIEVAYTFLVTSTTYYRLTGLNLKL